ncbi:GGDEF domain-containing protein [Pseudomonas turukhanskensis]|uniref:diguanylate cyclase n=1 Tax=Pseudomonas turukhanskensis TaxID=1806536 RepID=A0A9W6NGW7_9PSED|nr:GGDEF domain-containing protein [Pseudomonas turukhanskensis]GLK91239.1 GGDEF domain-containing protein [Pseudomonas turukhanskensis]
MAQPLDLPSVLIFSTIIHVMLTFLLGVFWRSSSHSIGFGWWVTNEALLTLGSFLLIAFTVAPHPLMLIVANVAFFAAMPLIETGLRAWFGQPVFVGMGLRWGLAAGAYVMLLLAWITGLGFAERAIVFSVGTGLQVLLFTAFLLGIGKLAPRLPIRIMLVSAAVVLLVTLYRIVNTVPALGMALPPDQGLLSVLMIATVIAAVLRICAMLLLLHGRVESGFKQATVQLEQRANVDSLTNLYSRAHFEASCNQLIELAHKVRAPVCLMLCDMDDFKRINDQLGHPEGDAILQRFASLVKHTIRKGDIAGRLGGDEFAVLFYGCDQTVARDVVERLRRHTAEITAADGRAISVSAGLVNVDPGHCFDQAYVLADQALYAAKANGRNTVVAREPATV